MCFSKRIVVVFLLLLAPWHGKTQVNVKDSTLRFSMFQVSYAYQIPGGDMANRFGRNSSAGFDFMVKGKSRLLIGLDFRYLFGSQIKENIMGNLLTPDGNLIGQDGYYAGYNNYERGWSVMGKVGYLFSFKGISPNPNCGPFITIGGGILEHKIRIEVQNNSVSALDKNTKKGYDRLSNGPALSATAGYMYLSNKRLINFFLSVEYITAFTQNRRGFNFDTQEKDTQNRTDNLLGFRIGWIIPLYKRQLADIYYN